MQGQQSAKASEHLQELTHLRKSLQSEAEHAQLRAEAEMADRRATISRLEADLMKVNMIRYLTRLP